MFLQADLHRNEYWPKLSDCLNAIGKGKYYKNRSDMFSVLFPYLGTALRNARQLDQINKGKSPAKSSPGTKVHLLLETLKPYLEESC